MKWTSANAIRVVLTIGLAHGAFAIAQTADDPTSASALQEIVVTGSNIPIKGVTDVPVTVLGPKQIEESGVTSDVLDLLRKAVPAFAGRSNAGTTNASNVNQATGGGSQISLRNLPTLVLINGRRVTYSSINGSGGKNFVDVNMIPVSAIERIEVLTDGASAIYGSDAVGGVVNVILKSSYEGTEVSGRFGATDNGGHYSERSASIVHGGSVGAFHFTASANFSKTDPLMQNQRSFSANDLRPAKSFPGSVGGNILIPGINSPSQIVPVGSAAAANSMATLIGSDVYLPASGPALAQYQQFNIAPYTSILLTEELKSGTLDFSDDILSDRLTAFGSVIYSEETSNNLTATSLSNMLQVGQTIPAGSPYNPLTVAVPGVVVGTLSTPQRTINTSKAYDLTLGFKGKVTATWNWEVGYTYSSSKVEQDYTNTVFAPNLAAAIAGGYDANGNPVTGGAYSKVISGFNINGPLVLQPALDPFARAGVNPAALANVYGTEVANTVASLGGFDAKIVGVPFSVPAGDVGLAIGAARRLETLSGTPDQNSYNASTDPTKHNWASGATFFDPFSKSRTVTSYYVETRVPLTSATWNFPGAHELNVSLAGRRETYSDAGTSSVPKIGMVWQPYDGQVSLRYSYSKSFAAPFLVDEYGPPNFGFGPAPTGVPGLNAGLNIYSGNGNNPNLLPSLAWSRSFGVAFAPKALQGFTASADYINIAQEGFQAGVGAVNIINDINALGSASAYFSAASVGAAPGQPGASRAAIANPGAIIAYLNSPGYKNDLYVLDYKINSGGVRHRAVDFNINYQLLTQSLGRFSFDTTGTRLISILVQPTPGSAWHQFAGYSTNANLFAGSNALWSAYSTVAWEKNNYEVLVGNSYRSSMIDINSGTYSDAWLAANAPTKVSAYTAWDLMLSHESSTRFLDDKETIKWSLGVNDVFNRMPPLAPLSYPLSKSNNGVDVSAYSPIGRFFYGSASVHF